MKKKIVASMLVFAMSAGLLTACGSGGGGGGNSADSVSNETEDVVIGDITYKKAKDITTDEITLTYYHFDQEETVNYLADRFEEIYPNIHVEPIYHNISDESSPYGDALISMVNNGDAPDIFMVADADFALSNMLYADISNYWDTDEETQDLADTINSCGIGCYETSARFAVPVKFFPTAMYVDLNVLEKLNIEAPTRNWTWNEMIQMIKDTTQEGADGMKYYGLSAYNRLDSYYGIAASQTIKGEFGFNGDSFDLGIWAVGEQEFADLHVGNYIAPERETVAMKDWYGDASMWAGLTQHVAMFSEAFWTFQSSWNSDYVKENYDLDIVPYVIPAVSEADATSDHHAIATIDFGGVSPKCDYPREAYELLKFMSFGVDGWKTRIELYNNPDMVNASGTRLKFDVMPCPITKNEDIWNAYIDMFCEGMDETHIGYWREYFASVMQPIPFGWTSIAGYWNFCDGYFNSVTKDGTKGIHNLVDQGKAKAADYADEATRQANSYHAKAMISYFGPSGYDILSEEEIAKYEEMVLELTQ